MGLVELLLPVQGIVERTHPHPSPPLEGEGEVAFPNLGNLPRATPYAGIAPPLHWRLKIRE